MNKKRKPVFFWIILMIIAGIGFFSSQVLFESYNIQALNNRKLRYLLLLFVIILICSFGYYSWKRYGHGWQHKVWLFFYVVSLSFLGVMAFIDQFIHRFSYASYVQLHYYRVFLLSSLPYIILYLLTRILTGKKLNVK